MKTYNLKEKIDVNTKIAKILLELPEEIFYQYDQFKNDFQLLKNNKNYNYLEFKQICEEFNTTKNKLKLHKKIYRNFITKYKNFIPLFSYTSNYHSLDDTYLLLKNTYKNKKAILDRINKLLSLKIYNFQYIFENSLNDNLLKCDSNTLNIDVATDGKITYKKINGPYCYINVKEAKYILEYKKELRYNWLSTDYTMIVSNLMFDTSTLPSYTQLNNFDIKPNINYEEARHQDQIHRKKQQFIDYIINIDDTLNIIQNLEKRLQYLINNPNSLPENNLQKLKEIYASILTYQNQLISQYSDHNAIEENEIRNTIKIKKLERKKHHKN